MKIFKYIISAVLILFFSSQQIVFSQTVSNGSEIGTFMQIELAVILIIIFSIFIAMSFYNEPKQRAGETIAVNEKMNTVGALVNTEFVYNGKIVFMFKIIFYSAIILSALYLIVIILLAKSI